MPRPTARVLALLEILQSGGTHTVPRLADQLGVDERTVRRYAAHLLDLGVPVDAVRGRYGGYRLAPGYRMPPLMLTEDEALAVLLGLVASRRAGLLTTSAVAAEAATAKLRRVLPRPLRSRLDALFDTASFTAPERAATSTETAVLLRLAEAARQRRPVAIRYTDRGERHSERVLHPYGIVAHSGRWYATGADSLSGEVRTFRLDRIASASTLPGAFDVPAGFDPADQVRTGIATTPWKHEVSVRVRAGASDLRRLLPPIATVHDIADAPDWVRVELRAERLDWLPALLAGLDRPFVVDEPAALRAAVRRLGARLIASADGTAPPPG